MKEIIREINIMYINVKVLTQTKKEQEIKHWEIFFSNPVTGLDWPRGFQEVKVTRFHDNGTGWW
jgi:hypothetical protein